MEEKIKKLITSQVKVLVFSEKAEEGEEE